MSEHDRHNPYGRQQQGGHRASEGYESPRQANQWQAEGRGQQGGDWQQNYGQSARSAREDGPRDYRFSGHDDPSSDQDYRASMGDDDLRSDQYDAARQYNRGRRHDHDRDGESRRYGAEQNREFRYRDDRARSERHEGDRQYRGGYPHTFDASGGNDFGNFTSEDYGGRDFYNRTGRGIGAAMRPSESYRPSYGLSSWFNDDHYHHRHEREHGHRHDHRHDHRGGHDYGEWRRYGESRGFLARAGDEVASWFGDEDAARRREQDRRDDHSGRGPSNYTRSDERIREDANDALTQDWGVDASHVNVTVSSGEVTLDGTVDSREAKRRAEDAVERVSGVKHVQNNLRVKNRHESHSSSSSPWTSGTSSAAGVPSTASSSSTGASNGSTTAAATSGTAATGSTTDASASLESQRPSDKSS